MADTHSSPRWLREAKTSFMEMFDELVSSNSASSRRQGRGFDPEKSAEFMLRDAVRNEASDIHLDPGESGVRVRVRVDGALHDSTELTHDQGARLIRYFETLAQVDPVHHFRPEEGRMRYKLDDRELDLRMACVPCIHGSKLSLRILDPDHSPHRIGNLGLSADDEKHLERWLEGVCGMCLVAGPTGVGKTTTLYSILHELKTREKSVITIEDPIEYEIDGITQIQVDRRHQLDFASGIRSMLRLDPDYLLVGEIRDADSCQAAVKASIVGHVLMSTLHCRDAAAVVTFLRNWGIENNQIASNLELVVAQRLVRKLCRNCRKRGVPSRAETEFLKLLGQPVPRRVWKPGRCPECHDTGYHGRTGIFEIWRKSAGEADMILENCSESSLREHLRSNGCRSVIEDGLDKAADGVTSLSEVKELGELSHYLPRGRRGGKLRAKRAAAGRRKG